MDRDLHFKYFNGYRKDFIDKDEAVEHLEVALDFGESGSISRSLATLDKW